MKTTEYFLFIKIKHLKLSKAKHYSKKMSFDKLLKSIFDGVSSFNYFYMLEQMYAHES